MFYKKSAPRYDENGKVIGTAWRAYDFSDSIKEAVVAYKRCRNPRTFILTKRSKDLAKYDCYVCGIRLNLPPEGHTKVDSAYIDYNPRTKVAHPHHYVCGWNILLGAICTSRSLGEAGAKFRVAQRDTGVKVT